ncbi:MAG: TrkA family potassium uptake protein [Actinomycetota bacterium]|nr:TrkA family potassium uptake protein [Actinomycetota bacterium]
MHFVIMGCGRVGSTLAIGLQGHGHEVTIIDHDEAAFRRLGPSFDGRRITGIGFDRDTLERANLRGAYAFAAVSSGDNSNILSARVARETFDVEHVVARIYDPGRAEIYQRLGIPTVATVRWTADQVLRRLLPQGASPLHVDPSGKISLLDIEPHISWVGTTLGAIENASGVRVGYFTRLGDGRLPSVDTVLQEGDQLQVLIENNRREDIEHILAAPRPAEL